MIINLTQNNLFMIVDSALKGLVEHKHLDKKDKVKIMDILQEKIHWD